MMRYTRVKSLTWLVLLALLILAGCSSVQQANYAYENLPNGSLVILKQKLTIPAGKARIYIQSGKLVEQNTRDQYRPHCWLLSWQLLDRPQEIEPSTFVIKSVRRYDFSVDRGQPLQLAANETALALQVSSGSVTAIEQTTVFSLDSEKYPEIRELACSYWDDPLNDSPLTLEEIRTALGDIFELTPAEQ